MQTGELEFLFNIKRNQVEMLRTRGYDVGDEIVLLDPSFPFGEFVRYYGNNRDEIYAKLSSSYRHPESGKVICVSYLHENKGAKLPLAIVNDFIRQILDCGEGIIISNKPPSPDGQTALANASVEFFLEEEMTYNPLRHFLSPQYQVLSEEEKRALFSRDKIKGKQLPILLSSDPVARYLGLKPGVVVKILENNVVAEKAVNQTISYRFVV